MSRLLPSLLVALSVVQMAAVCHAQGDKSTKEDFQEWIQLMKGRWIGDVPLVHDWPGLGKRGERLTAYVEINVIADGDALLGVTYLGQGKGTWMTTWNPNTKQIKETVVISGGIFWENQIIKQGPGKWLQRKLSGSMPDGKKIDGDVTLTVSPDGKTHTWTGDLKIEGTGTDPIRDVYKRLAQ